MSLRCCMIHPMAKRFLALLWAYKAWWITSILVLTCALILVLATSAQLALIPPAYSKF